MKSAIEEIYYGEVTCENLKPQGEYLNYFNEFNGAYNKFTAILPESLKAQFENIMNLRDDMEAQASLNGFKYGFETGLKIGMEIALK